MFNIKVATSWLADSVGRKSAATLRSEALQFGLQEQPYINLAGADSTLPAFDQGYHFRFDVEGAENSLLEILRVGDEVLQAGYQVIFATKFFGSPAKRALNDVLEVLLLHLGPGEHMRLGSMDVLNFQDETVVAYASFGRMWGKKILNIRIGNRALWG